MVYHIPFLSSMDHSICEVESCKVKSKGSDFHSRCLYHLGMDHDMDTCTICKAMPRSTWKGRWNRIQRWKETGSFVSKDTLARAVAASKRPGDVLTQDQGSKKECPTPVTPLRRVLPLVLWIVV